jgi:hypothetical protein
MVFVLGVDGGPLIWQNVTIVSRARRNPGAFFMAKPMHLAAQTLAGLCVIAGLFIVLDILDS